MNDEQQTKQTETSETTKAPTVKKVAKKAVKKAVSKKPTKEPKAKFGADLRISKVGENPRQKGSETYKRFEEMRRYVAKNPKATVADVLANTDYRRPGFEKDREREAFKVTKV